MTVNDFGAIINVNIHSGWILFFVLEKLTFGSNAKSLEAAPTILKEKKCIGRCEGDVLERKGTGWVKRNPMHSYRSKLFCLVFFSPSHPPWDLSEVGSDLLPLLSV